MNKIAYIIFTLLCIVPKIGVSQDKLFLRNGNSILCKIITIDNNSITYKDTAEYSLPTAILKTQLILAELKTGEIYIFGTDQKKMGSSNTVNETRQQRQERKMIDWKKQEDTLSNNILGFYLPVILFGRLGISYERLFANKSIGIKIPLILSYNPFALLPSSSTSTTSSSSSSNVKNTGTGIITGIDINFYHDIKPKLKYYFGPRMRYGTDIFLGGIEGMTVQIQNGIMKSSGKHSTNTFGIGFGFLKLTKINSGSANYTENQVYPSFSVTWRLGFRI